MEPLIPWGHCGKRQRAFTAQERDKGDVFSRKAGMI